MEHRIIAASPFVPLDRVYLIQATMPRFKGCRDVTVHMFRYDTDQSELEFCRAQNIVGKADRETPEGATVENALRSVLETFTPDEGNALLAYLEKRYADQIARVVVCPIDIPVPLGMVPFASIPEGGSIGFIHFDKLKDYDLPFGVRGFYDLEAHEPIADQE